MIFLKRIRILVLIFLITIFSLSYFFRYEISFNLFTFLNFDENQARRYSFYISERPIHITIKKIKKIFSDEKSNELQTLLSAKKGFLKYKGPEMEFFDGNYYLDIFNSKEKNVLLNSNILDFSNKWKSKVPVKVWSTEMSEKSTLKKSSNNEKKYIMVEAKPIICGENIIYAKQDGSVGAINYKTGEKVWYKKYGNSNSSGWPRMRGFSCSYEKNLDKNIILLPTAGGVFCLNATDGNLLTSRCGNKILGAFQSRVSPHLFNGIVYVATINPSGVEAYNFKTGKLLWRTNLERANPWNNFIIDKKNELVILNLGSPIPWSSITNSKKYKYSGSLIALNADDGKIVWQFQEHSKDSWNHDFVGQPILSPTKIKGKDVVITFSKSGSIYFIDRKNGLPIFPVKKKSIKLGNFEYAYGKSTAPKPLLDTNFYNFLGKDCSGCYLNTKVFGPVPPILKIERMFDGHDGGPQWPGATIDVSNNLLIVTSSHNIITKHYADYIPQPLTNLPENFLIQKCTTCHDSKGRVKGFAPNDEMIVPSLFLTSKIYNKISLSNYLKKNNFHSKINFNDEDLKKAYEDLKEYDEKLIKNKKYQYISVLNKFDITKKEIYSKSGPFGKITAISLDDGKIMWQIPAGTYKINEKKTIIGSKTYGAITNSGNDEGISFYTGSFDKMVYAINNINGKYLWSKKLKASGSALPLVHNTPTERWIFIIATGGRVKNDTGNNITAFKQKL